MVDHELGAWTARRFDCSSGFVMVWEANSREKVTHRTISSLAHIFKPCHRNARTVNDVSRAVPTTRSGNASMINVAGSVTYPWMFRLELPLPHPSSMVH